MKHNHQTFVTIADRIKMRSLKDAVEELDERWTDSRCRVIVFSNGISDFNLKRLLALHHIGREDYDWKRSHGCVSINDERQTEEKLRKYYEEFPNENIMVISDSRWAYHPMSESLYEWIVSSDVIIEVKRQRQTWLDAITHEAENGSNVERLIELVETFKMEEDTEGTTPWCDEYQHVDVAIRALLSRDMTDYLSTGLVSADTIEFMLRRILGISGNVLLG